MNVFTIFTNISNMIDSRGKLLTSASNLRKHIKIIHKVHEEYKCDSSGKSFTVSNTMKTIHKDQKDFIRGSCRKLFISTSYLRLHIKTLHEGHKHFKCDSCRKSFTLLPNLTIVNRTINYWNLRGHIKTIHECHKDYKCGSCEKLITGATSLRIHIKTIHEAEDLKD